jgi:tyrosine-protein kinase Etk/Wzc
MNKSNFQQTMDEHQNDHDFEKVLTKLTSNWGWFLFSILLCFSISYFYASLQMPVYLIQAKVMINDPKKGSASNEAQMLGSIGSLSGSAVQNEAEVLRTRFLIEQVVRDMDLNIQYFAAGGFKNREMYISPFLVKIIKASDSIKTTEITVKSYTNTNVQLITSDIDTTISYNVPLKINGVGIIEVSRRSVPVNANSSYSFLITSVDKTVGNLLAQIEVVVPIQTASIIGVTLNYTIPKKGEDILNNLLRIYTKVNLEDRNELAENTYSFIQNRLSYLGGELGQLEGSIQGFKQRNQITEMSEQSRLLIANSSQFVNELAKIETQVSVLKSIRDYLLTNEQGTRVLPSSLVVSDPLFNELVEKYNALILERSRRLMGITTSNPIIVSIDQQIATMRLDMMASLANSLKTLEISRKDIKSRIERVESKSQNVPEIERNYLGLARQQKIKEELFIYLMQKGEETAISKTYNTPNSKTIDPPKADSSPISPNKKIYYVVGIFLGLVLPASIIYLKMLLNTRIDAKDDITQQTDVPIIGEISKNEEVGNLVVANKSRSAIAEQFRALRTSLSFYLGTEDKKVVIFTSSMSGEGKSFASINLANVLAISGKKVLLMELDLRKPGLSSKLNMSSNNGFTNYIIDSSVKVEDIIKPLDVSEHMFLLSSGALPPNPAEILMSSRTSKLFDELKTRFDYIIIDSPPIGIVTDAQLLSSYADLCIFVVRQNYTLKSQLNIVKELAKNSRMKKLSILVNDIDHKNGYGYGYGNGYSYGYGNYGQSESSKGIFSNIKSFFQRK